MLLLKVIVNKTQRDVLENKTNVLESSYLEK